MLFNKLLIKILSLLYLFQLSLACVNFSAPTICYAENGQRLSKRFGTKTTFNENQRYLSFKRRYKIRRCKPIMFYLLSRHAIRYPSESNIKLMNEILPSLQREILSETRSELCSKDIRLIRDWRPRIKIDNENNVTPSGANESIAIGQLYRRVFTRLLDPYQTNIEVGVTDHIRTSQTADAFLEGARKYSSCEVKENEFLNDDELETNADIDYEEEENRSKWSLKKERKDFLSSYDRCDKMNNENNEKPKKSSLLKEFLRSDLMRDLRQRVQQRLGLRGDLDNKYVSILYKACSFEYAIFGHSPWCAAFGDTELRILEYYNDLEDFIEDAYGNPMHKIACEVLRDLVQKIRSSTQNSALNHSYLYFSHSGLLKRLWAVLGLFDDYDMRLPRDARDGFCKRNSRFWRSSLNTPFNAHFNVVLYKCRGSINRLQEFKILTTVNGAPVTVKGCDKPVCDLQQFLLEYHNVASNCDFNRICARNF